MVHNYLNFKQKIVPRFLFLYMSMWWFLIRLNLVVVTHEFEISFVDLVFNIFSLYMKLWKLNNQLITIYEFGLYCLAIKWGTRTLYLSFYENEVESRN